MMILHKLWNALKRTDASLSALIASDAVRVFEIELLLFPVLVVLLASVTLVCGGRCALWQWWTAVGMAIVVGWLHSRNTRHFYIGTSFYLLSLLALWVACGISIVPLGDDPLRYHLPGIRLLIEGWNPVWQGRWDLITAAFGIDPSETKTLFVLPNAKGVWYLDAVAYFFVGNPFNLMMPAFFLLMAVAAIAILRNFQNVSFLLRLVMILAITRIVPPCWNSIDAIVGLSGICLLSAMHKCIARNEWDWLQLLCYSFLMSMSKQTGMFHCFLFWVIFSLYTLWKSRMHAFRRLLIVASVVAVAMAIVGASPYFSSWKEFGHPLYPKYSVDEEKYPVYNMVTCDFLTRNDDAAAMGRIGAYVYYYVSPEIATMYYKWKLKQETFKPWCFCNDVAVWTCRMFFCGCLFLLAVLGKREDRIVATAIFLGTMAMPTEMIGFRRYCPWLEGVVIFSMPLLAGGRYKVPKLILLCGLVFSYGVRPAITMVVNCGARLASAKAAEGLLARRPLKYLYNGFHEDFVFTSGPEYFDLFFSEKGTLKRGEDVNKTSLGNLKLLQRQVPTLAGARIVDFTTGGAEADRFRASNGRWKSFYDNSFKVAPEEPLPAPKDAKETLLRVFPELLFRRLTGQFAWR